MTRYLLIRLLLIIPMLIGVTALTFIISRSVSTDPLVVIVGEKALEQPDIVRAAVEKWALDKSLPEQYLRYLHNLARGDLGVSFKTKRPVTQDLSDYLPATVELTLSSLLFAVLFGLPLGIASAMKAGGWVDRLARMISLVGASVPPFWSGLLALFLFYYRLGILPGPGRLDARMYAPPVVTGSTVVDGLIAGKPWVSANAIWHLILPSMILGWFTLALLSRIMRSSLLEVLQSDYIRTARSKGLQNRNVIIAHALRNASIPVVTVIGLAFAGLMSGAIMTETIFAWPGIGRYAVESAINLDYPAVLGTTLLIAVIYMIVNLFVDILYHVLDPRVTEA